MAVFFSEGVPGWPDFRNWGHCPQSWKTAVWRNYISLWWRYSTDHFSGIEGQPSILENSRRWSFQLMAIVDMWHCDRMNSEHSCRMVVLWISDCSTSHHKRWWKYDSEHYLREEKAAAHLRVAVKTSYNLVTGQMFISKRNIEVNYWLLYIVSIYPSEAFLTPQASSLSSHEKAEVNIM